MTEIRNMRPEEREGLLELIEVAFNFPKDYLINNYPRYWMGEFFKAENKFIAKENGKIVGHVGLFPMDFIVGKDRIKAGGIGGVATHPDYRNRGYMGKLLELTIKEMKEQEIAVSPLWGDPIRYGNYGWTSAVRYVEAHITKRSLRFYEPRKMKIEKYNDSKRKNKLIEQIIKVHEKEPMSIFRDRTRYVDIIGKETEKYWRANDTWVANPDRKDFAYLTVSRLFDNQNKSGWEHGGDAEAIITICKYLFDNTEIEKIKIMCPYNFSRKLNTLIRYSEYYTIAPVTVMRIVDLKRTLAGFKTQMEERVKSSGRRTPSRFSLQIKGEREVVGIDASDGIEISDRTYKQKIRLSHCDMVRMLFGIVQSSRIFPLGNLSGVCDILFPLDCYIWSLDNV